MREHSCATANICAIKERLPSASLPTSSIAPTKSSQPLSNRRQQSKSAASKPSSERPFVDLYQSFRKQDLDFWKVGRVFRASLLSPATPKSKDDKWTVHYARESKYYGKPRPYVIIEIHEKSFTALSVSCYDGRGVPVDHSGYPHHARIYSINGPPESRHTSAQTSDAERLLPRAIRVDTVEGKTIAAGSRLDYRKKYPIEDHQLAENIGMIDRESMEALVEDYRSVSIRGQPPTHHLDQQTVNNLKTETQRTAIAGPSENGLPTTPPERRPRVSERPDNQPSLQHTSLAESLPVYKTIRGGRGDFEDRDDGRSRFCSKSMIATDLDQVTRNVQSHSFNAEG